MNIRTIDPGDRIAVLTGDLVAEGGRHDLRALQDELQNAARRLCEHGLTVPYDVDYFRSDVWELIVLPPEQALRAALVLRAALRSRASSPDARIAIGVGSIDFLPEHGASSGSGPAYQAAGEAFEAMPRTHRLAVSVESHPFSEALDVIAHTLDHAILGWTTRQAVAVFGALEGKKQAEIGAAWPEGPISQQAVAQHLRRAGWDAVEMALEFFQRCVADTRTA